MGHFIVEIGCEDLPEWSGNFFEENFLPVFRKELHNNRISFEEILLFYTIRRLIIFGKNVSPFQHDYIEEIYGPPVEIGIDKEGKFTPSAVKFAESQGVKVHSLKIKERKGKKVLVAEKREKGKPTLKIIPEIFTSTLKKIEIPRAMTWSSDKVKFIRPVRWIFALFDNKKMPIVIGKIRSNRFTYGHRVLSPGKIKIEKVQDYPDALLKNFVIFDQNVRKRFVEEKIKKLFQEKIEFEEELLKKITNLIEYPVIKKGKIPEKYYDIPDRVKEVVIKKLKCIPLYTENGNLYDNFIIILDGVDKENIKENYERVMVNKFEDAKFFIKKDTERPLKTYLEDLKKIVFHPRWGTIYQRVERLKKIFNGIKGKIALTEQEKNNIEEILSLCKNDLATLMVSEFPELQGIIGRIYAEKEGYNEKIYLSIEQHYLPRFTGDKVPDFKEGCIVSLIDRIETLSGFIIEGVQPTASGDPYGLKKTANGIIEIMWKKSIEFPLRDCIKAALLSFDSYDEEKLETIYNFLLNRVDNLLANENIISGIRKAVISVEKENILRIRKKIDALKEIFATGKGVDIFIPFVRVANILKQAKEKNIEFGKFDEKLLVEDGEKELYQFYLSHREKLLLFDKGNKFFEFLQSLTEWRNPIDKFFDEVLVMCENEKLRKNRLSLLKKINELFLLFADFSYLSLKEIENA